MVFFENKLYRFALKMLFRKKKIRHDYTNVLVTNIFVNVLMNIYIYTYDGDNLANCSESLFLGKVFVDEKYCLAFLFAH